MRIPHAVAAPLVILLCALVPRDALADKGNELPAIRVLRNQGLQRQDKPPSRWSLSREEEALKRYRDVKYFNQIRDRRPTKVRVAGRTQMTRNS
jgi:hypothetical protein